MTRSDTWDLTETHKCGPDSPKREMKLLSLNAQWTLLKVVFWYWRMLVVPGVSGLVNVISLASRESTLAVAGVDFLTMTDGQCV